MLTGGPYGSRTPPAYTSPVAVYVDLVRYRELFANLFRRDFQAKYRGSVLGLVWSLVNPLALMAVYLVVFGLLWQGDDIPHYPLYLLAGLACWIFFATSLQTGARSLVESADLVKKVRFPRQLVPFSVVATQLVTFAAMLAILIVLSLVFVPDARPYVVLSIPLAALFLCFVAGMALVVASLNVILRDVEHILAAALLPWFFLTPVLWSFEALPPSVQGHETLIDVLQWANFVGPPISAVRDPLWLGAAPAAGDVIYLAVAAVVALALGAFVFGRVDDRIAIELCATPRSDVSGRAGGAGRAGRARAGGLGGESLVDRGDRGGPGDAVVAEVVRALELARPRWPSSRRTRRPRCRGRSPSVISASWSAFTSSPSIRSSATRRW